MLIEVSITEAIRILDRRINDSIKESSEKKIKNNEELLKLKTEAMKATGRICSELTAGAMASVSIGVVEKKPEELEKAANNAYKDAMKAIEALQKIIESLIEINKALK